MGILLISNINQYTKYYNKSNQNFN